MTRWSIGGVVVIAVIGGICYLNATKRTPPALSLTPRVVPVTVNAVAVPTPPAKPTAVIEVTDIDPFLDPPVSPMPKPVRPIGTVHTALGVEIGTPEPVKPASAVIPIPPAVDDEVTPRETAVQPGVFLEPMPRPEKRSLPVAPAPHEVR